MTAAEKKIIIWSIECGLVEEVLHSLVWVIFYMIWSGWSTIFQIFKYICTINLHTVLYYY